MIQLTWRDDPLVNEKQLTWRDDPLVNEKETDVER